MNDGKSGARVSANKIERSKIADIGGPDSQLSLLRDADGNKE